MRLVREWLLYVAIMGVLFALFFRDRNLGGVLIGLAASGPMYLLFGAVLAKFGYQRKSLRQVRSDAQRPRQAGTAANEASAARPKPAPTRRTGGGSPRPGSRRR